MFGVETLGAFLLGAQLARGSRLEATMSERLPSVIEDQGGINITWYRATVTERMTFGGIFPDIPVGAKGWLAGMREGVFIPDDMDGHVAGVANGASSVEVDLSDYRQARYVLPESYWARFEEATDA